MVGFILQELLRVDQQKSELLLTPPRDWRAAVLAGTQRVLPLTLVTTL